MFLPLFALLKGRGFQPSGFPQVIFESGAIVIALSSQRMLPALRPISFRKVIIIQRNSDILFYSNLNLPL